MSIEAKIEIFPTEKGLEVTRTEKELFGSSVEAKDELEKRVRVNERNILNLRNLGSGAVILGFGLNIITSTTDLPLESEVRYVAVGVGTTAVIVGTALIVHSDLLSERGKPEKEKLSAVTEKITSFFDSHSKRKSD